MWIFWVILTIILVRTLLKHRMNDGIENFWRQPTRFGPHLTPTSSCGLLLPKPRYEVSLPPDHRTIGNDDCYYQHLNEPNVMSYLGDPLSNTRIAHLSPQTAYINIKNSTPKYNEYYIKNRVGRTPYAVPAVKIPTDNSVKFVNVTYNPTQY